MSYGGQQNRTDWYDRDPLLVGATYNSAVVGPVADTQRWSYTVPASRTFYMEVAACSVQRAAVGAGFGQVVSYVQGNGNGLSNAIIAMARIYSNAVGDEDTQNIGASVIMTAGTTMDGRNSDTTTGGTCFYLISMKGTEFDA